MPPSWTFVSTEFRTAHSKQRRGRRNEFDCLADGGRRGSFVGDEAAGFVGAVAEGSLGGLAAAAEGDGGLVSGDFELGAARVDEFERSFHDERAIGTEANGDVGHGVLLRAAVAGFWEAGGVRWISALRPGSQTPATAAAILRDRGL